jgi:hypothetical protein
MCSTCQVSGVASDPSPDLKQKMAAAFDIPLDDLEEADNRLSPDRSTQS